MHPQRTTHVRRGALAFVATACVLAGVLWAYARVVPSVGAPPAPAWLLSVRVAFVLPPLFLVAAIVARFERIPLRVRPGALLSALGLTFWMTFQLAVAWIRIPYHVMLLLDPAPGALLIGGVISFLIGGARETRQLQRHAERDPLTGLLNRYGATRAWNALPPRTPTALAVVDLNELKSINDRCGHLAGDALLRTCAGALANASAPDGWAARWGGDEFLVVLPRHTEASARDLLVRATRRARPSNHPSPWAIGVTLTTSDRSLEEALAQADTMMYADKGRPVIANAGSTAPRIPALHP